MRNLLRNPSIQLNSIYSLHILWATTNVRSTKGAGISSIHVLNSLTRLVLIELTINGRKEGSLLKGKQDLLLRDNITADAGIV